MNYTTNFNLNKPEGTDLYNHLTVDNPNMDTIDAAMQANKLASVGTATELVSGTVHAITRTDSDQNIFKFKATGDFKAGDTITVDGVSVNAYTTDGQQLLNDAYVLSAEVLCILDGTSLWVLVNKIPDATEIDFSSTSGIASDNVSRALDEIKNNLDNVANKLGNGTFLFGTTLSADVLQIVRIMATGIRFYANSNVPANRPTGCDYGSYIFINNGERTSIIYLDKSHIATTYNVLPTDTTLTWHIA